MHKSLETNIIINFFYYKNTFPNQYTKRKLDVADEIYWSNRKQAKVHKNH